MNSLTTDTIWEALQEVKDPEIPAVSLVEMGIVREVVMGAEGAVTVTITPTFAGCPALLEMEELIRAKLGELGVPTAVVKKTHHPPWSSDWITPAGREKLRQFGLAPPPRHGGQFSNVVTFFEAVPCPYCGGTNSSLKNSFGSTLCRAIHYCHDCQDSFEQFKPL